MDWLLRMSSRSSYFQRIHQRLLETNCNLVLVYTVYNTGIIFCMDKKPCFARSGKCKISKSEPQATVRTWESSTERQKTMNPFGVWFSFSQFFRQHKNCSFGRRTVGDPSVCVSTRSDHDQLLWIVQRLFNYRSAPGKKISFGKIGRREKNKFKKCDMPLSLLVNIIQHWENI